ncbi:hypothetical protein KCU97_g15, partial [Aureobasidium melanogenum]
MGKQLTSSVSMIEEDLRSQTRASSHLICLYRLLDLAASALKIEGAPDCLAVSYLSDSSISFNQTSAETPLRPAFGDNHADMQAITFGNEKRKSKPEKQTENTGQTLGKPINKATKQTNLEQRKAACDPFASGG